MKQSLNNNKICTGLLIVLLCALLPIELRAQKAFSNSFKISTGTFYINDRHSVKAPYQQIGASYERRVYKKWYAGAGYYIWNAWNNTPAGHNKILDEPTKGFVVDQLEARINYKMMDLYSLYKWEAGKKHVINLGLGASYCWGKNSYLKWYAINPEPPYDIIAASYSKNEHYWGFIPQVGYDFLIIKNRVNVGADVRGRFYINRSPAQYDLGVHARVNF